MSLKHFHHVKTIVIAQINKTNTAIRSYIEEIRVNYVNQKPGSIEMNQQVEPWRVAYDDRLCARGKYVQRGVAVCMGEGVILREPNLFTQVNSRCEENHRKLGTSRPTGAVGFKSSTCHLPDHTAR